MAFKRGGSPVVTYNARWVGRESFDAWELVVDAPGYTYTFVVPKVCGNLSLVSRSSSPVVAAPAPAPPPAPRAVPPPPPVAQAAPPPAPTPILSAAPWPPHDYFRWTATGFIGSYFAGGGNATQANDVSGSLTYGGEIGRMMWRHVGAEVLVDLAPKYKIESLALSEHPEVNSYMANAIGLWSTRFQDHFQPYVSGGVGGIQMHASVLPADALTGLTINSKVSDMIFGWNIGAGAYAFAGHSVGLRADVRWYKAADNSSFVGTPAENITHALVSGIDFWRANIGVAFRW
jgi:opacity protein-like surface antigen